MLKKENRLSSNFEYNITKKYGTKAEGETFYGYFLKPQNYEGKTKAGVVVSNKFSKSAVVRNRIKRLFKRAIKKNFDSIPKNYWVVIYPKYSTEKINYEKVNSDVVKILQKVFVSH